jgi:hypothetical protein
MLIIIADVHYEFSKQSGRTRWPSACLGCWFQTSSCLNLSQGTNGCKAPFSMLHKPVDEPWAASRAGVTPEAAASAAPWEPHCPVTSARGPLSPRTGLGWDCRPAACTACGLLGWHHDQDNRPGQLFPRLVILIFSNDLMLIDYRRTTLPRSRCHATTCAPNRVLPRTASPRFNTSYAQDSGQADTWADTRTG